MVLVDTNVLVALVLPKDPLHDRAVKDLERLVRQELYVISVVVSEACFLLGGPAQRARLHELLQAIRARPASEPRWDSIFAWLMRYAEHDPDWADACLVVLSDKTKRVWTYDSEFRTVWRRLDGTRVPLATKA